MNSPNASKPRYCTDCGTQLHPDAQFCHNCGAAIGGGPLPAATRAPVPVALRWGVPAAAIVALGLIALLRSASRDIVAPPPAAASSPGAGGMQLPDISSMTPAQRADRLFNRVMSLSSEGKSDSAAFFAPMALAAMEALQPADAHMRYDMGLVALVAGDLRRATAESEAMLKERPNHLLGLSLAAKIADARGDAAAARAARQKLVAAEKAERASGLPEYTDHDADIRATIDQARRQ